MDKIQINAAAKEHAKKVLGERYDCNPNAVKSITSDFKAGFEAARIAFLPYETKAKKYDELDEKISKFYPDDNEDGTEGEGGGDLCEIGEVAAAHFGWLN